MCAPCERDSPSRFRSNEERWEAGLIVTPGMRPSGRQLRCWTVVQVPESQLDHPKKVTAVWSPAR
jgi:hypothetical protein